MLLCFLLVVIKSVFISILSFFLCVCSGAFNYLKDNFSNAPSLDMSAPSLCMLVRLMVAQVQECIFERVTLTTRDSHFTSQLRLAQEATRVSEHIAAMLVFLHQISIVAVTHSVLAVHVTPAGVGHVPVSAAGRDAAADERLRAVFMGVDGPGQIGTFPSTVPLLHCCHSLWSPE